MIHNRNDDADFARSTANGEDSLLDVGLRAAFGDPTLRAEHGFAPIGVLDDIEHRLGVRSHVLLRDDPDDAGEVAVIRGEPSSTGRYQVLGEIARGGMGVVLKGRDVDLGRDVAMKVLQPGHASNPAMVRRFVEEAQIAGQLQHPGVLPVYELGLQPDRRPFFTMKLVKGRTLAALLEERRDPSVDRAQFIRIFESVCQTIAYAHSRGVIHRDLKPSNILVGPFGEVQVVDWGLAKVLATGGAAEAGRPLHEREADQTIVQTVRTTVPGSQSLAGSVMGTPAYMSPEQARGETDLVDERTDVFALGGMLCEILTGKPPFEGAMREMMADAAAGQLIGAITRLDSSGSDADLVVLAKTCLSVDRRERPRNAKIVASKVTAYLAATEDRARNAELEAARSVVREAAQRRARWLTTSLAAAIVLLLLIGWGAISLRQQMNAADELAAAQETSDALAAAGEALGVALQSRVGEKAPWITARAARERLTNSLNNPAVNPQARERATALIARIEAADRDRRLVDLVEEAVMLGSLHMDRASWEGMARQLREGFKGFGVDLTQPPDDATIARIRGSEAAIGLTEGIELWIGTEGQLGNFGVQNFKPDHLMAWTEVLYKVDADPFRTQQRKVYYAVLQDFLRHGGPNPAASGAYVKRLDELVAGLDVTKATPRSVSWTGTTYMLMGKPEKCFDLFRRAAEAHPGDFMLLFDCAFMFECFAKWQEAIPYLVRAAAIRPDNGGVWRKLGTAFRNVNLPMSSLDALQQAARLLPEHAPTMVDLALTEQQLGRLDEALQTVDRAIRLDAKLPEAHAGRGQILRDRHDLRGAIEAFQHAKSLSGHNESMRIPLDQWIEECTRALDHPEQASTSPASFNPPSKEQ